MLLSFFSGGLGTLFVLFLLSFFVPLIKKYLITKTIKGVEFGFSKKIEVIKSDLNKETEAIKSELRMQENKSNLLSTMLKETILPQHTELLKSNQLKKTNKFWISFLKMEKHCLMAYYLEGLYNGRFDKDIFVALCKPSEAKKEIDEISFDADSCRLWISDNAWAIYKAYWYIIQKILSYARQLELRREIDFEKEIDDVKRIISKNLSDTELSDVGINKVDQTNLSICLSLLQRKLVDELHAKDMGAKDFQKNTDAAVEVIKAVDNAIKESLSYLNIFESTSTKE